MKCNAGSWQPRLPKHPVPGAMGSIELMCAVLIYKYCDGLPLYRLENILARYGGELSRATLANWVIALARPLQPLINLIRDHQQAGQHHHGRRNPSAGTQRTGATSDLG